jgi:uncharacterized protein YecE (DUF72 family)
MVLVGTAGWSIPRAAASRFPATGSHLERYARVLPVAEINSSFHRPHAPETYAKWAAETPLDFRFAVKLPRAVTHDGELRRARVPLERFLAESSGLGSRRGPILVQLPPSLVFDRRVAATFFDLLRARYADAAVCEPRHASWFTAAAEALLARFRIARVAADPPPVEGADVPAGWTGIVYYRLHGSPRKYWSRYAADYIDRLARILTVQSAGPEPRVANRAPRTANREPRAADPRYVWCIFDNTASGAAVENALELRSALITQ